MAVSATVSPGKIFSSDEVITISELNKLGTPTVDISGAVGSLSISTNSINNSHVQAAAAIQLDKLASGTDGQIPICSATGVPTYVTLSGATVTNAGVVSLDANSIDSDQYVDGSIDTAHLSDDAIDSDKLDDLLTDGGGTAGSYTAADITVDAQGRVSAVASGAASHPTARLQGFAADGTWTAPTGVTRAKFTVVGAGGSGCSSINESGGGGGCAIVSAVVVPATAYTITVGEGVSQANSSNGRSGEDSTVVVGATTYTGGGGGGASSDSNGSGGTGTNGDVNFSGSAGEADEKNGGGYSFLGPVHGRGSYDTATSSDGFVLVEWME